MLMDAHRQVAHMYAGVCIKKTPEIHHLHNLVRFTSLPCNWISLTGSENSYDVPDFAEKFLGVAAGGTLEIYGEERIGWTKLTSTVERCEKGDCILFEQNKVHIWKVGVK